MKGDRTMYKAKTRRAYGEKDGKLYDLGDTIDAALKANMMVRDYEAALIKANPQLTITIRIEEK
jgi:lipopolysaccharide export system protein LptC